MRKNSKTLLGNRDRIEVAAAVASSGDGIVNATDLARQLGTDNNRVRAQLLAFADVGLLGYSPPPGGVGKHWFVRRESLFWRACVDLLKAWEATNSLAELEGDRAGGAQ